MQKRLTAETQRTQRKNKSLFQSLEIPVNKEEDILQGWEEKLREENKAKDFNQVLHEFHELEL